MLNFDTGRLEFEDKSHCTNEINRKAWACVKNAITWGRLVNTLRPRQNGRHFPDDIFKCIFFNENVLFSIKISLKFVPKGQINNIPALV